MRAAPDRSPARFEAVLLDLDGVLTATAALHARAWKETFDAFLAEWSQRHSRPQAPFSEREYRDLVDGKPREDGVRDFLRARGIEVPEGDDSGAEDETVRGLGRRKQARIDAALAAGGAEVFPGVVEWLRSARASGARLAVVSSSRNCRSVLRSAGIADLFDVVVDGTTVAERGLAGKPAPDAFLEAARLLGADPARSVVVEDAVAGVAAGRAGGFGLVVGIDRGAGEPQLRAHGADRVVRDLSEVRLG